MRMLVSRSRALGMGALLSVLSLLACSAPPPAEGEAELAVLALTNADVATVAVTITGPGIATPMVVLLAPSGSQWGGTVGKIPAGTDRTFTLSARDATSTELYVGQATGVTITPGSKASVAINGQQAAPATPVHNAAPIIDSLVASSVNVAPGDAVSLAVTAHDPNAGDALAYEWTANGGTFDAPSAAATHWTAPAADGTYRLSVQVR